MNIYLYTNLIIITLSLLFYLFSVKRRSSQTEVGQIDVTNNVLFSIIIFFILTFITGARGGFSADYYNYVHLFNMSGKSSVPELFSKDNTLEIGYSLLNKIVYSINHNPVYIMTVVAIIILSCYLKTFRRSSDMVWLSIILLLTVGSYYTSFNTIRQFLAGAILFNASKYIYDNNWKKYFLFVLLASTIHSTAIIMILFYFLLKIRWNTVVNVLIGLIGLMIYSIVYLKTDTVVSFFINNFYTGYTRVDAYGIHDGLSLINVVRPIMLFLFSMYGLTKINLEKIEHRVWFNAGLYFLLFSILSTKVELLLRFTYFFIPYVTLLIPRILSSIKNKNEKIIMIVLVTVMVCLYAYFTQRNEIYYFVWE